MVRMCPRCGADQLQDLRTWTYIKAIDKHICPICVFQGAEVEDPTVWNEDMRGGEVEEIINCTALKRKEVIPDA